MTIIQGNWKSPGKRNVVMITMDGDLWVAPDMTPAEALAVIGPTAQFAAEKLKRVLELEKMLKERKNARP